MRQLRPRVELPERPTGVDAQMELLDAYASPTPVSTPLRQYRRRRMLLDLDGAGRDVGVEPDRTGSRS